jgi:hypothetical protein
MKRKQTPVFVVLIVIAALAIVFDGGCEDSDNITAPGVVQTPRQTTSTPTPTPTAAPAGDISGSWTGTYNGISYRCDTSVMASFQQNGSNVVGTLTATGPCGDAFFFRGTVQGNTLDGGVTDNDTFDGHAHGTLSGSTLEITFDNGFGFIVSQLHLHR